MLRSSPLSLLLVLSVACVPESSSDPQRAPVAAQAFVVDKTLTDHRLDHIQVYKTTGAPCPASLGPNGVWDVQPLFPGATTAPLRTYCRARWTPGGSPNPAFLPPDFPVVQEAVVVGPMSGHPSQSALDQFSRAQTIPLSDLPPRSTPRSRLAILDAMPEGVLDGSYFGTDPAFSDHGHQVAAIARGLVCDDGGDCAVDLLGYSALQYRWNTQDGVNPHPSGEGAVGSQSDLARMIYRATEDWVDDAYPGAATQPVIGPLVLNISAGWHAHWGGDEVGLDFDPAVAAVHEALSYASCHGAITFAAAGNLGGLDNDTPQPLYPAAWEALDAPTPTECSTRYGVAVGGPVDRGPLVYAVGGVNPEKYALGMGRPDSLPKLTAAGSHVGFYNPAQGELTKPLSGTSASTAVVSASAALARAYVPGFSPRAVADTLLSGADTAGWLAHDAPEFCPDGGPDCADARVITACHALTAACAVSGNCVVTPNHCNAQPVLAPLTVTPAPIDDDWTPVDPLSGSTCSNTYRDEFDAYKNDVSECPIDDLDGVPARPMTVPMPPSTPCEPFCKFVVATPPRFHFTIGDNDISDSSILLDFGAAGTHTYEVGKLTADDDLVLEDVARIMDANGDPIRATFTYSYDGTTTAGATSLLIVED